MTFFKKIDIANKKTINHLWQGDYIDTHARNAAVDILSQPLGLKFWLERLLLVLGTLFITAAILLFFAYNWAYIPPTIKMGTILSLIAILTIGNFMLLRQDKVFVANLLLVTTAFMVGVFMAVFGQIYQTGADSYTLFLTWAIMILPWCIMTRFTALWALWLVVCNIAIQAWWDLRIYPNWLKSDDIYIVVSLFHYCLYIIAKITIEKSQTWLDKQWVRLLLSIGIFAPVTIAIIDVIIDYRMRDLDIRLAIYFTIFVSFYACAKWIIKGFDEYSVGFFSAMLIIGTLVVRSIFEIPGDHYISQFFLNTIFIIALIKYGYQYYRYVTKDFKEVVS